MATTAGIRWLLGVQNRDGGIPTFCRGWGTLPFDRSTLELTAQALRAWKAWVPFLPKPLATKVQRTAHRGLSYLSRTQRSDGAWIPLWFGNEAAPSQKNPVCGTAQVLIGLNTLSAGGIAVKTLIQRAQAFLISAQLPECNRVMAFPSALQVARICPMASVRSMSSMEPEPRALPSQQRSWDTMRAFGVGKKGASGIGDACLFRAQTGRDRRVWVRVNV